MYEKELEQYIRDVDSVRDCLMGVWKEMIDTEYTPAPCNRTAIHNLYLVIDHLREAERLIETAKRYDPEAEVPEEKPPCYLCANWQRTCKADTCHFIPA